MADPISIVLIYGSVRPGRFCDRVVAWASARIRRDPRFDLDVLDPATLALTGADSAAPALAAVKAQLDRAEAFVIVTPEYNHSTSGVLKNAIDYLYAEWNNKAVGFVSYGAVGGARAAEHLRLVAGELQMADVRQQVTLSLITDFENFSVFKPGDYSVAALNTLFDQVVAWSAALAPLRQPAATTAS